MTVSVGCPVSGYIPYIPFHTLQVMLLRAEFMYGEASEVLVAEHTILGQRRREKVRTEENLKLFGRRWRNLWAWAG